MGWSTRGNQVYHITQIVGHDENGGLTTTNSRIDQLLTLESANMTSNWSSIFQSHSKPHFKKKNSPFINDTNLTWKKALSWDNSPVSHVTLRSSRAVHGTDHRRRGDDGTCPKRRKLPETMGFYHVFTMKIMGVPVKCLKCPEKKKKDGIIGNPMNYPGTFECRWWIWSFTNLTVPFRDSKPLQFPPFQRNVATWGPYSSRLWG